MGDDFVQVKIFVVSDQGTGAKTSYIKSITDKTFNDYYIPTIGVDFRSVEIKLFGMDVNVQLWDTAGTDSFKQTLHTYYRLAHCFVVGYSITDRKSYESVPGWIKSIKEKVPNDLPIMIIGAKDDLEDSRCVSYEEAQAFAEENKCLFYESKLYTYIIKFIIN